MWLQETELEQLQRVQALVAEYGAKVAKLEWELSVARQQSAGNPSYQVYKPQQQDATLANLQASVQAGSATMGSPGPGRLPSVRDLPGAEFVLPPVTPAFQHRTAPTLEDSPFGPAFGSSAASQLELLFGTAPPPPPGYRAPVQFDEAGPQTPNPAAPNASSLAPPFQQTTPLEDPDKKQEAFLQLQEALSQAEAVGKEYERRAAAGQAAAAPAAAQG